MADITEVIARHEVLEILNKSVGGKDVKLINYKIRNAGENPLGFNGVHHLLDVEVEVPTQGKTTVTYFIKKTPQVASFKAYVDKTRSFYKEIGMYQTMFEDFKNNNKTKWRPEFYYGRGSELMVMEDLKVEGFTMLPERTLLPEDHVIASLDAVAIMHAAAIIFEDRYNKGEIKTKSTEFKHAVNNGPVTIGDVYAHLLFETEATEDVTHPGHDLYECMINGQVHLVDLLPNYTTVEKNFIKSKLPHCLRKIYELVKPSDRYKNVIVHADLWLNNLMFRQSADNKLQALIIDFQIARFAPPAHDIMMFLHLVQNKTFRDRKQADLLQYYYKALSMELTNHGLDINTILPWSEFLSSCQFYYELALITAIFYFQLIVAPGEICAEFLSSPDAYNKVMFSDRSDLLQRCFVEDTIFRSRMTETMDELIRNFILN